jgi:transcriptional regulator with XRE-family HTH domain
MPKQEITNCLWACRRKNGLSQKNVAIILGHKRSSQLSHYECGKTIPNLVTALKLEIIYRTPVAFLFYDLYRRLREEIRAREMSRELDSDKKPNN